jgi:hypothetical protein
MMADTPTEATETESWWQDKAVFKGFGSLGRRGQFTIEKCDYLGGYSEKPKPRKLSNAFMRLSQDGIFHRAGIHTFTIPWEQVASIEIEGPDQAGQRVTLTRVLAIGIFALGAQKKQKSAVIVVGLRDGSEAYFQTREYMAFDLQARLGPIINRLHRAEGT